MLHFVHLVLQYCFIRKGLHRLTLTHQKQNAYTYIKNYNNNNNNNNNNDITFNLQISV